MPGVALPGDTSPKECDCPPWVLRCVHFDGDGIVLTSAHGTDHDNHSTTSSRGVKHSVYLMSQWVNCIFCGDLCAPFGVPVYSGPDYAAALAAFHEAETALLGRTP